MKNSQLLKEIAKQKLTLYELGHTIEIYYYDVNNVFHIIDKYNSDDMLILTESEVNAAENITNILIKAVFEYERKKRKL